MCSWWHQADRSTRCPLLESWWLFPLFHLSCKAEEAPLASQCTSELKYRWAKAFNFKPAFWKRYTCVHCFSGWPPGMIWPTSWTVRAEFLSSVFTLITPWLSPPIDNMALAGSGAPRTPGLQEQGKKVTKRGISPSGDITIRKSQGYFWLFFFRLEDKEGTHRCACRYSTCEWPQLAPLERWHMDRSPQVSDHEIEKHSGRHHMMTQTLTKSKTAKITIKEKS